MSKNKIKVPALPVIQTTQQLEEALATVAALQNSINGHESEMNGKLLDVRSVFEPGITADKQKLQLEISNIQDYASAHPELFTKRKSVEFVHGTIGYRTGTPKLKLLGKFTWKGVLEALIKSKSAYLRTLTEVNKEKLLLDRNTLGEAKLRELGISVVQNETFFVDPKLEEIKTA